jgi:hypothetical protein
MTNRIWILGAADPEMEAIDSLLRELGETIAYATVGLDGPRVTAAQAYHVDCTWRDPASEDDAWDEIVTVECVPTTRVTRRIDHHRPGDPGFGAPPEEFLRASSIGQVIAELAELDVLPKSWDYCDTWSDVRGIYETDGEWRVEVRVPDPGNFDAGDRRVIPRDLVLTAAADHCLGHAYAGHCPGVDPDELLRFRVAQKVAFRRPCPDCGGTGGASGCGGLSGYEGPCHTGPFVSVDSILRDIAAAKATIESAEWLILGSASTLIEPGYDGAEQSEHWYDVCARDMRGAHVSELPEAGTRYGIPYVADGLPVPDGRVKIVCSGSSEVIRAFFGWAEREGLTDAYGDPERGFAGAYR